MRHAGEAVAEQQVGQTAARVRRVQQRRGDDQPERARRRAIRGEWFAGRQSVLFHGEVLLGLSYLLPCSVSRVACSRMQTRLGWKECSLTETRSRKDLG